MAMQWLTGLSASTSHHNVSYAVQLWTAAVITAGIFTVVALARFLVAGRTSTPRRPGGLVVGTDGRVSTSKFNALLWTMVLVFVLVGIALIYGNDPARFASVIHQTSPLYLVEIGGPFAAAILAKGIVGTAEGAGKLNKSQDAKPSPADIFTDDAGNTDLVDTQYVVFNLLVVGIVIVQFCQQPAAGAPPIADFLAILTGGSATTYVANKAVVTGKNPPVIHRVVPPQASVGSTVQLLGSNLIAQGDSGTPLVFLNGFEAVVEPGTEATSVRFTVPDSLPAGTTEVAVTVRSPSGAEANKERAFIVSPAAA